MQRGTLCSPRHSWSTAHLGTLACQSFVLPSLGLAFPHLAGIQASVWSSLGLAAHSGGNSPFLHLLTGTDITLAARTEISSLLFAWARSISVGGARRRRLWYTSVGWQPRTVHRLLLCGCSPMTWPFDNTICCHRFLDAWKVGGICRQFPKSSRRKSCILALLGPVNLLLSGGRVLSRGRGSVRKLIPLYPTDIYREPAWR